MKPTWVVVPVLALTLGHVFSNAVRTLPAVAADVLAGDLGLTAKGLAALTGAFPGAFALAMVPVGVGLDRSGVRRTALVLLAIGVAGSAIAALATGPLTMLAAQCVLGVGCAGALMCPMTYAARAMDARRFALWAGIIQAFGNSGMLLSASPLALLVEWQGWRAGFWAAGGLAALAFVAVAATVRQPPPAAVPGRSLWQDTREILAITASPRLRALMVFAFASFAAMLGVRGLWGGPWLMEIKGLARVDAGNLLLLATIGLVIGPALAGAVQRLVGRPILLLTGSHLVVAGLILALAGGGPGGWLSRLLGLAALPEAADGALLFGFGLLMSCQILVFPEVRAAVPAEQTGRALSANNIAFFGGAAVLQAVSGLAAGWGGIAAALNTFAVALLACTLGYLWLRRLKGAGFPRPAPTPTGSR